MPQLTRLAEWTVPPDEIDHLDHMSTLFYAWRADQAAIGLVAGLAGGPEALAEAGLVAAVVDRHTHFLREQRGDAALAMSGGIVSTIGAWIEIYLELGNAVTGELAATFTLQVELQRRHTRVVAPLPTAWIAAAKAGRIERPARGAPRSLTTERMGARLSLPDFAAVGLASHERREIAAAECDADGVLEPRRPQLRTPDKFRKTGVMAAIWQASPGFAWPALEKRALQLRPIRAGDVLDAYEALIEVNRKVILWGVWTFDARDQALVMVSGNVNAFFDLQTRRTEEIPADLLERLRKAATPALLDPQPA